MPGEDALDKIPLDITKKARASLTSNPLERKTTYRDVYGHSNKTPGKDRKYLNLKILRDDTSCPGACQVIKWVKGCFDALDKKYLRMLVIGIYVDPDDQNTVIESYTFKFSYTEDGGIDIYRNNKKISSAYTAAETKKATIRLLRTIVVLTQTLKSLPDDVMMTMKLLYYDDVTPGDYEPPGFRTAECDSFLFEEQPMNIKVGDVATPFHSVKMRIKTDSKQFELKDDNEEKEDKEMSEEDPERPDSDQDNIMAIGEMTEVSKRGTNGKENPVLIPQQCEDIPLQSPAKPSTSTKKDTPESVVEMEAPEEEFGVKCPCGCNEDDGLMVLCAMCKFWQHGVCFMILNEEDAPEKHICSDCSSLDNPEGEITDPYLVGLTPIAVQATCLWRRALIAATESSRVLAPTFARRLGVEMTVAQGLLNRLEKEGFIKNPSKGKRMGKIVNRDKIMSDGVHKYFKKTKKDEISRKQSKKSDVVKSHADSTELTDMPKETRSSEDSTTEVASEIESLAARTNDMSLAGRKKKKASKQRVNALKEENSQVRRSPRLGQEVSSMDESPEIEPPKLKRGKKRAIAKVDNEAQFDVSNSQDVDYDSCYTRKRKASVASRAIMV